MCGIARKIKANISNQNAYRYPDLAKAYPPKVPKVSEIITTDTTTIEVFITERQNSCSIHAPS